MCNSLTFLWYIAMGQMQDQSCIQRMENVEKKKYTLIL